MQIEDVVLLKAKHWTGVSSVIELKILSIQLTANFRNVQIQ